MRRKTIRKRMRAKLREIKQQLRSACTIPCAKPASGSSRSCKATSTTMRYRGTPIVSAYSGWVTRLWRQVLLRRGQRGYLTWTRMRRLADRWLPRPRVLHPYPGVRFDAIHPEIRASCGNTARGDLCGGYRATDIPTATRTQEARIQGGREFLGHITLERLEPAQESGIRLPSWFPRNPLL